jgi:hypothetical protein
MSDAQQPFLEEAGERRWTVRFGPESEGHPALGDVSERDDGSWVARRADGSERVVENRDEAVQFVLHGFASL